MVTYLGTVVVAALGAGDTLRLQVVFTLPSNFVYRFKDLSLLFESDDTTISMEKIAYMTQRSGPQIIFTELVAAGTAFLYELNQGAQQIYVPSGTVARPLLSGPNGDLLQVNLSDFNPTSVAGDLRFVLQLYQFNVEQSLNYPLNTSLPTITQ